MSGSLDTAGRFIGTWSLVSQDTLFDDGRTVPSRGRNPLGILIYDTAGNMAVQLMRTDSLATDFRDMVAFDTAMSGYLGYFGRFEVDTLAGVVRHHITGSSYFAYRGTFQERQYSFSDEDSTLILRARSADERSWRVLVWRRE